MADVVYNFEKKDIGSVNLVWEYIGKMLNTLCLVSKKKGFVYDKLLSFMRTIVIEKTDLQRNSFKADSLEGPPVDRPLSFYWDEWVICKLPFDGISYEIKIVCNMSGELRNNVKFITGYDLNATYNWLWSASAMFAQVYYSSGYDGRLEFSWAWIHGCGVDVNLGWENGGFKFTGSGESAMGNKCFTADFLH